MWVGAGGESGFVTCRLSLSKFCSAFLRPNSIWWFSRAIRLPLCCYS